MPSLNVYGFDVAVEDSCFGRECKLQEDEPTISASTVDVGLLNCEISPTADLCLARRLANLSIFAPSFGGDSESLADGPYNNLQVGILPQET